MKTLLLALTALALVGCNPPDICVDCEADTKYVTVPAPVVADTVEQDVAKLLASENEYRQGLGQSELTRGLSCTLYSFTGGDRIQSSIAGHNTLQGLTQLATYKLDEAINLQPGPVSDGNYLLPQAFRGLTNMYMFRCQGHIVVQTTGYYNFQLNSDDGSLLYVNGSKLIDLDNNHAPTLGSGQKYLRRGVHTIRLDYAQSGGGSQALVLTANGALINPLFLAH